MNLQVQRIHAIVLTVTDSDRAKNFYTQALGFNLVSDITVSGQDRSEMEGTDSVKVRIVTLQLGNELIELRQYLNIEQKPILENVRANDLAFQHLAIVVSDMERAYHHVQSFSIEPISTAPQTIPPENKAAAGIRSFKFKDSDRHNLELIWYPPDKGKDRWHQQTENLFLGIDHSAITISNTEQSLRFYRDFLGMQVDGGSLNEGETQARLDGLPEAKVKITALRPVCGGMGIELLDYLVPNNGRSTPPKKGLNREIINMQFEFVVDDIERAVELEENHQTEFDSPQIVQWADNSFSYRKACSFQDPDGHTMLMISE